MNKDVIYIDVDDDVTAIIGKIKKSKEKIVALVPPKRAGTLQSAVNLRLLDRMARTDKKTLVLITANQALVALAAAAKIPVAKNLQSKPELAEIPAIIVDDGDDIIDGSELPVGDHAKTVKVKDGTKAEPLSEAIEDTNLNIDGETVAPVVAERTARSAVAKKAKNRPKIPNFDTFRKKLFLIIGGAVALVALLVWMFVFAPAATVIITAQTAPEPVSAAVRLGGTAATNFKDGVVSSLSQQEKKDVSVEFDATGQKDVGEKATGTVRFSTPLIGSLGTIPAGTTLRAASGRTFTTDEAVTLTTSNFTGVNVSMTATASGIESNGLSGPMAGAPSGVNATIVGTTSGGTTQVVKVVSAEDVERARGQLIGQSTDEDKKALRQQFTDGQIVIDSSFVAERGAEVISPAVGEEAPASGKAKLTVPTTYTMQAVSKADLDTFLKGYIDNRLDDASTQKIYSTGVDSTSISNFRKDGETMLATVNATGRIGPKIDENAIKEQVKGKLYGEVQSSLESINGISEVDVQFSYFWVRTVPGNTDKIKIEFKVENEQ